MRYDFYFDVDLTLNLFFGLVILVRRAPHHLEELCQDCARQAPQKLDPLDLLGEYCRSREDINF